MLPLKLTLAILHKKVEEQTNRKLDSFGLIIILESETVQFRLDDEVKDCPPEHTGNLFIVINSFLAKEKRMNKELQNKRLVVEGCEINFDKVNNKASTSLYCMNEETGEKNVISKQL